MAVDLAALQMDVADAAQVARFWASLLDRHAIDDGAGSFFRAATRRSACGSSPATRLDIGRTSSTCT